MKKIIIYSFLLFAGIYSADGQQLLSTVENDTKNNSVNKGIGFGISLGYNYIFSPLYDAQISPSDYTLKLEKIQRTSYVISTTISAPLSFKKKSEIEKGTFYEKEQSTGTSGYIVPWGFYVVATVNLLTFNDATSGSVFNKKIDGGLGIGYRFNDDLLIALTYEMLSVRQPRSYLVDNFKNEQIVVNGEPLEQLHSDNDQYFVDKYLPGLSLKIVYQLRSDKIKEK